MGTDLAEQSRQEREKMALETEEGFEIWPQLSDSKHRCEWKPSTVLMMDDTNYLCAGGVV